MIVRSLILLFLGVSVSLQGGCENKIKSSGQSADDKESDNDTSDTSDTSDDSSSSDSKKDSDSDENDDICSDGKAYYEFASFDADDIDTIFGGGADVGGYGNKLFIRSQWENLSPDILINSFSITIPNMDHANEPPYLVGADGLYGTADDESNPLYQKRTIKREQDIHLKETEHKGQQIIINSRSAGEIHVDERGLFIMCDKQDICHFDMTGNLLGKIVENGNVIDEDEVLPHAYTTLGYNKKDDVWFAQDGDRQAYMAKEGEKWEKIFISAEMQGDHADGMDIVISNTGYALFYISDMTSNFIGQWGLGDNPCTVGTTETGWNEWKRFEYDEVDNHPAKAVEGMGYGPLGHFWATTDGWSSNENGGLIGGSHVLYELGGGDLQEFLPPPII